MQSKKIVLLNRPVGALKETDMGVFDETLSPLEPGEVLLRSSICPLMLLFERPLMKGRFMELPVWVRR